MSKYWRRKYTFFDLDDDTESMFLVREYKTIEDEICGSEHVITYLNLLETLCDVFGISTYELKDYLEKKEKEKE